MRAVAPCLLLLVGALILAAPARAGSGPWTLEPGEHNVYVGGDYFRYAEFEAGAGTQRTALETNITAAGLTGVWTYGMSHGLEAEVKLAFESVRANSPSEGACTNPDTPKDWCDPTANVGDLAGRVKWRVVDEVYGAPISIAVSGAIRTGEAYANQRARLTTLGDGNTDLGGILSLGRTATLGRSGWYRLGLDAGYWYRFPNRVDEAGKVPADEIGAESDLLVSLHSRFGIGPSASAFTRLGGVALDPATADFRDPDYWSSLRATQVKVGGKLGLYSMNNGPTVSIAVLQTVYAVNNPADTLAISVGVGQWIRPRTRSTSAVPPAVPPPADSAVDEPADDPG